MNKVFLLSPANASGKRAQYLTTGKSLLSLKFRSPEGCSLAEAYAFMSSLYFRGKLAYGQRFGQRNFIIAPGFGLVPLEWNLTPARFGRIRETEVSMKCAQYVEPFRRGAEKLAADFGGGVYCGSDHRDTQIILLGSVATGKYLDILRPVFGDKLYYPAVFKGLGDMSRGAIMLRACRDETELEYVPVD